MKGEAFKTGVGGRVLSIETGKLAEQANAAVTVHYGDTVVLVTACASKELREGVDFLPLTIDYEERLYAAGKIPGGFIRREGRPSEQATLASRLTDRPLRPLLPKEWRNDVQIIITVLSVDQENDPDILAVIGSSAALMLSEVPFYGPVSAVRVGYINDELVLNPTLAQLEDSSIDLVVASTKDRIIMLEAGAREVGEDILLRAIEFGHRANQDVIKLQDELQRGYGKPKLPIPAISTNPELTAAVAAITASKVAQALSYPDKARREQEIDGLKKELTENLGTTYPESDILAELEANVKAEVRNRLLKGERPGGRGIRDIRPISCEIGLLPRTHGSALFTRGQTQVLTITTLGSAKMEQILDGLGLEETKRFIHHYNFPPFSTGEVKRLGSPGRREIGHGALVERALEPVLPNDKDFPYTIRLVSEVLSSSGSTSMASVCASSLSLMDAGIPVRAAVGGIAMGLITDDQGNYTILTDIEGLEDAYGDMDFKVAGTAEGITAVQMDTKIKGLSMAMVEETLAQAKAARLYILNIMNQTISTNRPELSPYAPRMYKINIPQEKIGAVIGPGGKVIRAIIDETKTTIDIKEDGTVMIGSSEEAAARKAISMIEDLTKEVEVGSIYTGKVTRILPFGAFVEILPGKEGMVHISELADYRVASIEDEVEVGDEITVKVIRVEDGKIGLSRKAVFEETSANLEAGKKSESRPFRRSPSSPPRNRPRPQQTRQRGYDRGAGK